MEVSSREEVPAAGPNSSVEAVRIGFALNANELVWSALVIGGEVSCLPPA
jgi:hypothetical protein